MLVSADLGITLSCTCVRCGADRDMPDNSERRMPAHDAEDGITVTAETRCRCGATRVRVKLEFGEFDGEEEQGDGP